ncbi:MAG: LON peptidase substrate-binding domain-containing protein [Candidatus Hydrogenedentota bacterium]
MVFFILFLTLSHLFPLFPLPNVVLFPSCYLPLHIFEPRYREMIAEIDEFDRHIVLALLKPGWEPHYHQAPDVFSIACLARVEAQEKMNDGRFNILVQGVDRVELVDEIRTKPYRQVVVKVVRPAESNAVFDRNRVMELLDDIMDRVPSQAPEGLKERLAEIHGNGLFADTIAHILQIPPQEKQEMLETFGVAERLHAVFARMMELRRRLDE